MFLKKRLNELRIIMKVILTICDTSNTKCSKSKIFDNLRRSFKNDELYVLGDNLSIELENYIKSFNPTFYENKLRGKTQYLIDKLNFCVNNFDNNDTLYLVEDDYIHTDDCNILLDEGLQHADYVTLYDHPDKYVEGPNPEIVGIGEQTILFKTNNSHWKYTNSTTGTFACKQKTIKEDYDVWIKFYNECSVGWWDYLSFKELRSIKNRKIASCVPGRSSHMHSKEMLSPFFDYNYDSFI